MIQFFSCCSSLQDINPAQVLSLLLAFSAISKYMNMSFSQTDTNHRSKAEAIVLAETGSAVHSTPETVCSVVLCCVVFCCVVLKIGARKTVNWEMLVFKHKCGVINLYWIRSDL